MQALRVRPQTSVSSDVTGGDWSNNRVGRVTVSGNIICIGITKVSLKGKSACCPPRKSQAPYG